MRLTFTRGRFFTLGLVFLAYTALACITLSTLLAQFNSAVPGGKDSDYYQFLWGYWWIGHALGNGQSPLWTDYTLYPHVSNLAIHTLAAIWYPVYAIAEPLIGRLATGNLMVLLGYSISGTAMFAWLRRRLDSGAGVIPLAFVGGLAFAFSPYMMTHASYIQLNLTPLWWFPVILLLWEEIAFPRRLPRLVTALILALALWGLWLTDLQYLVWLPFVVVGYVLWTLWASRKNGRWLVLVGWGVLSVALMAVLAYIYPLSALLQVNLSDQNEYPPAGLKTLYAYSMPPEAFLGLAPPIETKWLGRVLVCVTWAAVILSGIVWWRGRKKSDAPTQTVITQPPKWLWFIMAAVPLILALGPDIVIGETRITMPYMLLHNLLGGQHRIPGRMTGPGAFLLLTFLVLAWQSLLTPMWARRKWLVSAAAALVGVAIMADVGALSPFPTRRVPDYPIHHQIAEEAGDFVIMDVPIGTQYGWTGIGRGYFSMYYGTVHEHRMVNGWLARIPYSTLAYYLNSPLYSWLAGVRELSPEERIGASEELAKYVQDYPIGYMIAYRGWIDEGKQSDWVGWLNMQPGFCPAQTDDSAELIWWRDESLGCEAPVTEQIEMASAASWTHIGAGWYNPETIGGPNGRWANEEAALRLSVLPDIDYELTFTALAFDADRTLTLSGADGFSETVTLTDQDWQDYTVIIPAGALPDGLLTLEHNGAVSAAERGLSEDARPLAAAYSRFSLKPVP